MPYIFNIERIFPFFYEIKTGYILIMTRKAKIKGGGANLNPLAQLRPNTERNNSAEMTPYRPPYENTDEPKKQTQTQIHTETPTIPIPKPIPTSTNNLF